ncbi:908_t:CDS:2, partial [Acaulospora colombiana]
FLDFLSGLFGKERKGPLITLSWDEAHVLNLHGYPDLTKTTRWTQFNEFRRVLEYCDRSGKLFSLLLSTTGNIDQLSPAPKNDSSLRIETQVLRLPYPFINLDFDQFADGLVDPKKGFKLSGAIQPEWMVRWSTRYINGDQEVKDRIFDFAQAKLLCKETVDEKMILGREDILAIMGLRLGLKLTAQNKYDADVAKGL